MDCCFTQLHQGLFAHFMDEPFKRKLSRYERQVQLLAQTFAQHAVSEAVLEGSEEFGISADLYPYRIEVTAMNGYLDFAVDSLHTRELFSFARVHRACRKIVYSLRPHILSDSLLSDSLQHLLSAGSFRH